MLYRYAPPFPPRSEREPGGRMPMPQSPNQRRRQTGMAAGMLLVPYLSLGCVLVLFLVMR